MEKLIETLKKDFGLEGAKINIQKVKDNAPSVFLGNNEYFIFLPEVLIDLEEFKMDIFHEFTHIALAENIHPTFASFGIVAPKWWRPRFELMLQGAADVAVNTLLWHMKPDIAEKEASDISEFLEMSRKIEASEDLIVVAFERFQTAEWATLVVAVVVAEVSISRAPLTPRIKKVYSFLKGSISYLFPRWALDYRKAIASLPVEKDFAMEKYLQPLQNFWRESLGYDLVLKDQVFYFNKCSKPH
jgi:hypothetical protein